MSVSSCAPAICALTPAAPEIVSSEPGQTNLRLHDQGAHHVAALRQNAPRARLRKFPCPARGRCEIAGLHGVPALLACAARLYPSSESKTPWRPSCRAGTLCPGDPRDGAQPRHARRQVRPRQEPDLRHRLPGAGAALPDAEGARPSRRAQYRGLCHRISRLAARHPRPAVHARAARARQVRHPLSGRHQRGHRRHRAVGHAAGRATRGGQVRRRVRPLVRQGAGRRSHRRCLPSRQFRRHLQARRRAGADGGRPHRRVLHHRAPVRVPFRRRDDPDPESGGRSGDPRLRPLRLGDVALLRHLGRAQVDARHGGIDRGDRRQPGACRHRHSGRVRDAGRRAQHPAA